MKRKIPWFVLSNVLVISAGMFFDEPSSLEVSGLPNNASSGYSLSYQKELNNLLVGAPNDKTTGNAFVCPMKMDDNKEILKNACQQNINSLTYMEGLTGKERPTNDYKFMFGASVSALQNSYLTCAPMWYGRNNLYNKGVFVWGACFEVKKDGETKILEGDYGIPRKEGYIYSTMGGFGWKMLVDDINDLVLISKPGSPPFSNNIVYVNKTSPQNTMTVAKQDRRGGCAVNVADTIRNLGTAIASGNFFNYKSGTTVYAVGLTTETVNGMVRFLGYSKDCKSFVTITGRYNLKDTPALKDTTKNMFGASLCNAKLNRGNYDDLVVGAPAQPGDDYSPPEIGAIHIYTGASKQQDFMQRKLTIMGEKEGSRFGTTISAHDLDADGLHEIFVSAPYEDDGLIYILSGDEINTMLANYREKPIIPVKAFKSKQEVLKTGFQLLGFSITPVSDLDDNGCDELAVGAPKSDKVLILRCIPSVTITIRTELVSAGSNPMVVPESVKEFQVNVCIDLTYQSKMTQIAGEVQIKNEITGRGTSISAGKLKLINLRTKPNNTCNYVNVTISNYDSETYTFTSKANVFYKELTGIDNTTLARSRVRLSPSSVPSKTMLINRACSVKGGGECKYEFEMEFKWSGGKIEEKSSSLYSKYVVGKTGTETLTLQVINKGKMVEGACVKMNIVGAAISKIDCNIDGNEGYRCVLPAQFVEQREFQINLRTNRLTNDFPGLRVNATLHKNCLEPEVAKTNNIFIEYDFDEYINKNIRIVVNNDTVTQSITEKSMKTNSETIEVMHIYMIENNGEVEWHNLNMTITNKDSFVQDIKVSTGNCKAGIPKICTLNLPPKTTVRVIVTSMLKKQEIEISLMKNQLKISTELYLSLSPTIDKIERMENTPVYEIDSSFPQNYPVIVAISVTIAIIIIAVIVFVLYKVGFFKRKQKEILDAEIKRRSVMQGHNRIEIDDDDLREFSSRLEAISEQSERLSKPSSESRRSTTKEIDKTENGVSEGENKQ